MTLERKILLILLAISTVLLYLILFFLPLIQNNSQLREKIVLTEKLVQGLQELPEVQSESTDDKIDYLNLVARFPEDRDLLDFGFNIRSEILQQGLHLKGYQQGKSGEIEYLEYQIEGPISSFLRLLETLYLEFPLFEIAQLIINSDRDPASYTLRVYPLSLPPDFPSYSEVTTEQTPTLSSLNKSYTYSIWQTSSLFYQPIIEKTEPEEVIEQVETPVESTPQINRNRLHFIGHVETENEGLRYYFKDQLTGQILKLSPLHEYQGWKITAVEENLFKLSNGEILYEVNR